MSNLDREIRIAHLHYKYPRPTDISPAFKDGIQGYDIVQKYLDGCPIISLGIQAEPGTKFIINGHDITMGPTGIYQIEDNTLKVTSLYVSAENRFLQRIIFDIIYEIPEEEWW